MNFSTNSTSSLSEVILNDLNILTKIFALIANIVYFLALIIFKRLQKLSYFHIHHINFIGLVQSVMIVSYAFFFYPAFDNLVADQILCYISETLWGTLKFVRAYSTMILSIYRYCAVFKRIFFNTLSSSIKWTILTAAFSWFISFVIYFISKYLIGTTYGLFCLDGFSSDWQKVLIYFGASNVAGFIIPSVIVIIIYVWIQKEISKKRMNLKINQKPKDTNQPRPSTNYRSNYTSDHAVPKYTVKSKASSSIERKFVKKENSLALQLITINSLEILSFILIAILSLPSEVIFKDLNKKLFDLSTGPILNIIIGIIPISTIYFITKIK